MHSKISWVDRDLFIKFPLVYCVLVTKNGNNGRKMKLLKKKIQ